MRIPPSTLSDPKQQRARDWRYEESTIGSRIENAISRFIHHIMADNHGIKEKNILSLLLPLGFPDTKIDTLLVAALNQLGELRGAAAHAGLKKFVGQFTDPKSEFDRIMGIIKDLRAIDDELTKLLRES